MTETDTIAAVATPPGEGGVALVRVSGPDALTVAARVFRPARPGDPARCPGFTLHYGRFVDPVSGETLDDGLLSLFRAPRSYTGEDTAELSCHGGRAVTRRVLQAVLSAGARPAEPGEFTRRAFLNGRLDLAQAEAVADLVRARSDAARRLARRQLEGGLSRRVGEMRDAVVGILAAIEVTIDFSDEVGDLDHAALSPRLSAARADLENLLATADRGRVLREGLRAAIVGRPNVGKSSLLNRLLRADRAIVTPVPGTTRDLVEEAADLGGSPIVLIDTAGLRETDDPVERIGVERARAAAANADVVLFVFDAAAGFTEEDTAVVASLSGPDSAQVLIVANKIDSVTKPDLAGAGPWKHQLPFAPVGYANVSALTGAGLDALETLLARLADDGSGDETALVASERHREALAAALDGLREAERTCAARLPGDFIAIDARAALDALGRITGETAGDDVIARIFRDFCVGK